MNKDADKTKEQLIAELAVLRKKSKEQEDKLKAANQQLDAQNQQLQASMQKLKKQTHKLDERIKELNCLHSVSEAVRTREKMEEILQDVTEAIPPGWQYPKITCAKITLWDKEFKTENYKDSQWKLSSNISVIKKIAGKIEVCYLEEKPESDIGPFLNEERILLDTIAEQLGRITKRENAEEALKATNQQLRAANQQLDANNQQLRATEQQLRAANQQLDANNQQLRATEQQLQAANQQLYANNLQLIASEQELKKEKIFSEKIVETAEAIIVGLDKDHIIRIFNQGAENITGYKKDEVIGKDWFNLFFPKEMLDEMNKVWKDAWGANTHPYINPILAKSGEERIISWQTTGMYDSDDVSKHLLLSIGEDITERKQAEEKLKESEERFELAMNASNDGLFDWNLETNEIYYSPGWKKMIGYQDHELPNDFSVWEKTTAPEDVKKSWEMQQKLITKQIDRFVIDFKMKHKDGHWVDILSRARAIFDEKGNAIRIVGTHTDITERKRAEEKLKESETRYRRAQEIGNIGNWEYNFKTDSFWGSEQGKRIYGFDPEHDDFSAEDVYKHVIDRERVEQAMIDLIELNKEYDIEFEITPKGGTKNKIIRSIAKLERDKQGKPFKVTGVLQDITERKQAEEELTKLSTAVAQSPSVIAITDTGGKLQYVNPKFTEITGYSQEEAIGQNPRILKSGEQPDEMYKELWKTISSGKTWRGEFYNKKKNGELFWEKASVSPILDNQGKIINYIKVAEDITRQKRNEHIQRIIHNISNAVITSYSTEKFLTLVNSELGKLIDTTNFFVALYDDKTDRISLPLHHDEKDRWESYPAGKSMTNYVIKTGKPLLAKKAMIEKLIKSGEVEQVGHLSEVWLGVPLQSKNKVTGIIAVQSYDNENAYDEADVKMLGIISHQISLSLERLKAEEELNIHREHLEELVKERTAELEEKNNELERYNRLFEGREFRIKELKDQVKELMAKLGE